MTWLSFPVTAPARPSATSAAPTPSSPTTSGPVAGPGSLLEQIADFPQQFNVLRSRRRRRWRYPLELVDLLHHEEDDEGEDDEIDGDGDEAAIGEHRHPCLLHLRDRVGDVGRDVLERDEIAGEIEPARYAADHRHDEIADHRVDDLAEGAADDHADRQINDIALYCKLSELAEKAHADLPVVGLDGAG